MKFYLPFADRRISYNCKTCGSMCCKSHLKFGCLKGAEFTSITGLRPEMEIFSQADLESADKEQSTVMMDLFDSCSLLDDDGGCEIEKEFGRSKKPWVCRLFPLSHNFKVGSYVVANFHVAGSVICPFDTEKADGYLISHDDVLSDLKGLAETVWHDRLPKAKNLMSGGDELIEAEREIRDRLADLPAGASLSEVLAAGTGMNELGVADRLEQIFRQHRLRTEGAAAGADARALALFIPSLRIFYIGRFERLGIEAVRDNVADWLFHVYTYAKLASQMVNQRLTAQRLLRVAQKCVYRAHLASLLDKKVSLWASDPGDRLTLEKGAVNAQAFVYLLRSEAGAQRTLRELILEFFSIGESDPIWPSVGALEKFAPYLSSRRADHLAQA